MIDKNVVKKLVEEKINEKNRLILDLKEEKIKLEDKKYFEDNRDEIINELKKNLNK